MRARRAILAVFAIVPTVASAREPSATERALASALFEEGRTLLAEGRAAAACPKLAESQRLDPGGGTLLNVALCHEREGRLATAFAEFQQALAWAHRDQRPDRASAAEEHLAAIRPRLSGIVVLGGAASPAELRISLDGALLGEGGIGSRLPLDPGPHELVVTHVDGRRAARRFRVEGEGLFLEIALPALPALPAPAGTSAAVPRPSAPSRVGPRVAPWVVAGGGAALMGVGLVFGLRATRLRSDVTALCPERSRCTEEGRAKNDDAVRAADVATVVTAVGIAAVGVGVALLLQKGPSTSAHVDPWTVRW